jgi:hypothetical protein
MTFKQHKLLGGDTLFTDGKKLNLADELSPLHGKDE